MRSLPDGFVATLAGSVGESVAVRLEEALRGEQPVVSVRANPRKGMRVAEGADGVPWEPLGVYLPERPLFAADPAWHQGCYYVQDASSMAVGEAVRRQVARFFQDGRPVRYLDSCAAPGGKSIAALDALPEDSFLVANEFDSQRANILAENLARYGAPDVAVTRGDTRHLGRLGPMFDIVAADVPCSGEGMMRKDADAVAQWSPGLVRQCAQTQREILHNVWKALKPGGFLIYSTCTFNRIENEENVAMMMEEYGAESIDIGLDGFAGVQPSGFDGLYGYRFLPGLIKGEGLFVAVLRKPGDLAAKESRPAKPQRENASARKFLRDLGIDAPGYYVSGTSRIELRPEKHRLLCESLDRHPSTLRIGLPAAEVKGRDFAPLHELALSTLMTPVVASAELGYADALAFLRRETPVLPDGLPKGYVAVGYRGHPLGWMKNLGNRANNLLPDYLRLRLDPRNLPSEPPHLPLIQS